MQAVYSKKPQALTLAISFQNFLDTLLHFRRQFLLRQPCESTFLNSRSGVDEIFDDRHIVDFLVMHGAPERLAQSGSAVLGSGFKICTMTQQQLDCLCMPSKDSPVQRSHSCAGICVYIHAAIEQESDRVVSSILAGPEKAALHLLKSSGRDQGS